MGPSPNASHTGRGERSLLLHNAVDALSYTSYWWFSYLVEIRWNTVNGIKILQELGRSWLGVNLEVLTVNSGS